VIAGVYHDHLFVPDDRAEEAVEASAHSATASAPHNHRRRESGRAARS
jgi:hypothetical protein